MSDVIDATLMHLIKSERNIQNTHNEHPSHVVQEITSMSDLTMCYWHSSLRFDLSLAPIVLGETPKGGEWYN